MNRFVLNTNIVEVETSESEILLKNKHTDHLYFLNEVTYKVIKQYAASNSINSIKRLLNLERFSNVKPIEIINIVEYAKEKEILIDASASTDESIQTLSRFETIVVYLYTLLGLKRLGIELTLTGSFKFYKVLHIKVKDTNAINRFFAHRIIQGIVLFVPLLTILFAGWLFFQGSAYSIDSIKALYTEALFKTSLSLRAYFLLVITITSALILFHELGHYLMYKINGGKNSELGAAMVHYLFPTAYVSVNSVYFWKGWKGKLKKIVVSFGGAYFDFFSIALMMIALHYFGVQNASFSLVCLTVIIMVFFRAVLSLNPFLAYTDGYFILNDLLDETKLFEKGMAEFKRLFSFKHPLSSFQNKTSYKLLSYILLSFVFIGTYWASILYFVYQLISFII